jgi:hypothetical protein
LLSIKDLNAEKWILELENLIRDTVNSNIIEAISKESYLDSADKC